MKAHLTQKPSNILSYFLKKEQEQQCATDWFQIDDETLIILQFFFLKEKLL